MLQEEQQVQTKRRQAEQAIQLARANRWEDAVAVNRSIIKIFPDDADSYNRLGKALMELSRYKDAKKAYRKALQLDSTNQIARKNLDRLTTLAKSGEAQAETWQVDPALFIEEMGKSAVATLEQTSSTALAKLSAGDRVELRRHDNTLAIETPGGEFVGTVEPKLRLRLVKLIEAGNQYAAAVTSLGDDACQIIIKETYQDPRQAGRPSFPTTVATESTRPYTKGSLIRHENQAEEQPNSIAADGEGEEIGNGGSSRNDWDSDRIVQEGHIRLNDAAAAEEASEEELEEE